MTLIIISGGIDLSAGSVVALTSVVAATLLIQEIPPALVVLLILAGGAIGRSMGVSWPGSKWFFHRDSGNDGHRQGCQVAGQ